jgi:hypothetical protein
LITHVDKWGWKAIAVDNGLFGMTLVPAIGARVLTARLGDHQPLWVNADLLGQSPSPGRDSGWPNHGGYKTWPAPQTRWVWPPPPSLDHGPYSWEIVTDTPACARLRVTSPVEQWGTPGLRLERQFTLFGGGTRVQVDQTIANANRHAQRWSVWDITQFGVNHPGERDFENFWVYFPLNPASHHPDGVWMSAESGAWRGEVVSGVYGVQYLPENKKIFADSQPGWIGYVDERDGAAYIKTFDDEPGEYPDDGARIEVWINQDPFYLEVEVLSPLVDLSPGGSRYTFTEQWYATRLHGPILAVNPAGAITTQLDYQGASGRLGGTYGVFYAGTVHAVFLAADGTVLGQGAPHPVTPLESFALVEGVTLPPNTARIELRLSSPAGQFDGLLDALALA